MDLPISTRSLVEVVRSVQFRREFLEREFNTTPDDAAHIRQLKEIEDHILDFLPAADRCALLDPADDLRAMSKALGDTP